MGRRNIKRGTKTLGILAVATVGTFLAYKLTYPTYVYRYRMTVDVEVGTKIATAASVIEVRLSKQPRFLPEVPAVATTVVGEAVFVDLGEGRSVVALLASGPFGGYVDYPQHVIPGHFRLSYADSDLVKFPALQGRWDLDHKWLPTFVTFADLTNANTARVVPPGEFEQFFGTGVRLNRVSIEMTSDPVTHGIASKLPMLTIDRERMRRIYSHPARFTPGYRLFVRT